MAREEEIVKERLRKIEELRKKGINPYAYSYERTHLAQELQEKYKNLKNEAESKDKVKVAGRVMSIRDMGAINFISLQDGSGKIQLVFKDKLASEIKNIDSGDFIGVEGTIFRTKRGELSVLATKSTILTKAILPLPEKWHGLKNEEERYRKRYLDILTNPEIKELFVKKAKFWKTIRDFMIDHGFLEIETPVLETCTGGAAATPFETHHNALDVDVFLRISMGELWQKKLMVAGYEKTFEIGRQFRNEGMDMEHLQDYSQMEFYWAYADFKDGMKLTEEMYKKVALAVLGTLKFKTHGFDIDLGKKWQLYDYETLIKDKTGINIYKDDKEKIMKKLDQLKMEYDPNVDKWRLVDVLWKYCRTNLSGPGFLINQPVEVSPLAKRNREDGRKVEQFQIIIAGSEMGNGYSELNDPIDQDDRFKRQRELKEKGDKEAQEHDKEFVEALKYGMPPACGFGVSERLFCYLVDKPARECVIFPLMKPLEEKKNIKENLKKNFEKGDEKVLISEEAKKLGLKTSYAIISGVKIRKSDQELEKLKKSLKVSRDNKKIEAMRKAYKSFGVDPSRKTPSAEALIERLEQGKSIYNINTLVDAYNFFSVKENLPMASYDISKIAWPIILREAKEGEKIAFIGGEIKNVKKGEIVYSDQEKIVCLDFNYRDCDETKITDKTKEVIVFVDGCEGISDKEILEALDKTCEVIIRFNGGKVIEKKLVK